MNLLISDAPIHVPFENSADNKYVDLSSLNIANCIGCFGCWVKTPGKCVIRDDATAVYPLIAASSTLVYVSRVRYGCYDTRLKTMLERAIPIQKAFIRLYNGETHHVQRNVEPKDALIIAYGCNSEAEQDLFRRLVARNAYNMMFKSWNVIFTGTADEAARIVREVTGSWQK